MQKIQDHIAQLVEDNTRFAASDIETLTPQQDHQTTVQLFTTETVAYRVQQTAGTGALPQGVTAYPSAAQAQQAIEAQQQRAEAEARQLLSQWAQGEGQNYRRYLPPAEGFLTAPHAVGVEIQCGTCTGAGKNTCSQCNGKKNVNCGHCNGRGQSRCQTCQGTGLCNCDKCQGSMRVRCSACSGSGKTSISSYNGDGISPCGSCYGTGQQSCWSCTGGKRMCSCSNGNVYCSPCSGSGHITCRGCGGAGFCTCSPCAGTGTVHAIWEVVCEVNQQLQTQLEESVPQALHSLLQRSADSFGTLQPGPYSYQVKGMHYTVQHPFVVSWSQVQLRIQSRDYHLLGVGADAKVHDYQNIVSDLLQSDLEQLETAIQQTGWFSFNSQALADQLRQFSTSEMNLRITDAATQGIRESTAELEGNGMVSESYVNTSLRLLSQSFSKLLNPHLLNQTVVIAFVCTLMSVGLTVAMVSHGSNLWLQPVGYSLIAGVVLWVLGEYWRHRSISMLFSADSRPRIVASLRASAATRNWRLIGAATLLAVTVAANVATQNHAWVKQKVTEKATVQSQIQRANYFWQSSPTWTHFNYGDPEVLKQHAHAPEVTQTPYVAMAYAAWLLTRPDSSTAQAQEARQVLQSLPAESHKNWHWPTLTALADYVDPATQAQGLAQLQQAGEQGHGEALFALSKHYAHSDPALSMRYLTKAADKQQHDAAYELGTRYLEGRGVQKNVSMAKTYFLHLILSDVPGAQDTARKVIEMRG